MPDPTARSVRAALARVTGEPEDVGHVRQYIDALEQAQADARDMDDLVQAFTTMQQRHDETLVELTRSREVLTRLEPFATRGIEALEESTALTVKAALGEQTLKTQRLELLRQAAMRITGNRYVQSIGALLLGGFAMWLAQQFGIDINLGGGPP